MPAKKGKTAAQSAQSIKKKTATARVAVKKPSLPAPKQSVISGEAAVFLSVLSETGNVTAACRQSGLARRTAYDRFAADSHFAAAWLDALGAANDVLLEEARIRATTSNGINPASDTLLIYLLNQAERQQKWRNRISQTGQIAVDAIENACNAGLITEEARDAILDEMVTGFDKVSLV